MEFTKIEPAETGRTYHFPDGKITVLGVEGLCVRPSGTHRLETVSGMRWIIPTGWIAIELDIAKWTV